MENKVNTIKHIGKSDFVMMGNIRLRQPLPTNQLEEFDPFILIHHFGPYAISELNNPLDLGPHPHRGFEPATFLFKGEQLHRDSLGNESIVKAGDVQWTTAGRGIVHSEGPSKDFVKRGGEVEGIQLWVNLPANKKMIAPNYQHIQKEDFNVVASDDGLIDTRVITGELSGQKGKILAQTSVNSYVMEAKKGGNTFLVIEKNHNALLYLLNGKASVNGTVLEKGANQLVTFHQDGNGLEIGIEEDAQFLFLSGEPIDEKVVSWGPYVMNSQTEILEAMRDYQMGKMGFLPRD